MIRLPILTLVPLLLSNEVITLDDKFIIETKEERDLKGMDYFLTGIILPSLKLKVKSKYCGFLLAMEKHEDQLFKVTVRKLGHA